MQGRARTSRPLGARSSGSFPFALEAGLQGWVDWKKGKQKPKECPSPTYTRRAHIPSMGPRLPRLCPNRKVLANAGWEGRCGAF